MYFASYHAKKVFPIFDYLFFFVTQWTEGQPEN